MAQSVLPEAGVRAAVTPPMRPDEGTESALLTRLDEIGGLVDSLVASWHSSRQVLHARRWHRFPYQRPVAVTPLDDATAQPAGETLLALGRDISKGGVSFTHCRPLACRTVAVSFVLDDGTRESFVTRLKWCRFTKDGLYESGGQFQGPIRLQDVAETDWNTLQSA